MISSNCTHAGATALAIQIETYWANRGYQVRAETVFCGFHSAVRSSRYDVRSDMKNGLPQRKLKSSRGARA